MVLIIYFGADFSAPKERADAQLFGHRIREGLALLLLVQEVRETHSVSEVGRQVERSWR